MKEYSYAEKSYSSIWGFKKYCSSEEFETLKKEVSDFCKNNRSLPVSEQKKLFDEKYGHIVKTLENDIMYKMLCSIDSKVLFFVILTVLSLIGTLITVLTQ